MKKQIIQFLCICTVIIAFVSCEKDESVVPFSETKVSDFTAEVKNYNAVNLSAMVSITDKRLAEAEVGFVVAEKTAPTVKDQKIKAEKSGSKITTAVKDLKESTTYYARVYVKKTDTEYEYSKEISFTTTPMEITLKVKVALPINYPNATLSEIVANFTEIASSEVIKISNEQITDNAFTAKLKKGAHKMVITAKMTYKTKQGVLSEADLEFSDDLNLDGSQATIDKTATFLYLGSPSGFVIEEIFFTGTQTPEGKQYDEDKYIKVTNNSSATLYADSLVLLVSEFDSADKINVTPDVMHKEMGVTIVFAIPGNGTQYPVLPGESIILCQSAVNHKKVNSNSIDLSTANFEWLDDKAFAHSEAPNNPQVPNMLNYFIGLDGITWAMNNNGYKSYALAKFPVSKDKFLEKYKYDYSYVRIVPVLGAVPYEESSMKVPNEWIVDAVNLSNEADFQWIPINSSLDSGWTYAGGFVNDNTRYGKSVRRKVEKEVNGRRILKDTNNSTEDFEARAKPSLIER